jgi:tetratricopeptide (TPR) repeat protein
MRFLFPCLLAIATLQAQTEDLVEQATLLSNEGRHAEAVTILESSAAAEPGNEGISFRLATALVFSRRYAEARSLFERLSHSWDPQMAAMASSSLAALDRAEADELAAKAKPPSAEELKARAEYLERKALVERRQRAYDLVAEGDDGKALEAIAILEKRNEATPALLREKAAILDRMDQTREAIKILNRVAELENPAKETKLQLAALLMKEGNTVEAFEIWRDLRDHHGETSEGRQAALEIDALAPTLNLERWSWGELDLYASYLQRYDIGVANGRLRQGTYVPGARWIEPFVQADFSLDSDPYGGGAEGLSTIYNENLAGFHAGARIRPFPTQSFTLYVLGGIQKDLRGTEQHHGEWFWELIAGVNGFWAWGPGKEWAYVDLQAITPGGSAVLPRSVANWKPNAWGPVQFRLDWFLEAGGDAAYYTRLSDGIAYGQSRQGLRLVQFGKAAAFDAYALENLTMDTSGNYYDNYFEAGPGMRLVTAPVGAAIFTTSVEYVLGAYLGRNADDTRGDIGPTYSDFRITASLSLRW